MWFLAAALFFVSSAAAQTQGKPNGEAGGPTPTKIAFTSAVDCYAITHPDSTEAIQSVDDLVDEYNDGTLWLQLQADLEAILSTCQFDSPLGQITSDDFESKTFLVIFVAKNQQPYHVVVPQQQPYSMTLLGVKSVNVIILGDANVRSDRAPSDFILMSTQVADPLEVRIPALVKKTAASFVGKAYSLPVKSSRAPVRSKDPSATMYAYAATGITLPFSRAAVSEAGTIRVKDPESGSMADVKISTTYTNRPKISLEFTAVAGAVIGPVYGPQKMKVDAGKYASDPMSHSLTMVTVAWHPRSYDSSLSDMSQAERWAILIGGVLTPAAGVGLGVSFGIMRGFAIDSGVIGVWVPSASSGLNPGSDVTADANQRQLVNRFNAAMFIGGNYVFARGN